MEDILITTSGPIAHKVVPIIGDGACLFRALSYLMYGDQQSTKARAIREQIVKHVVANWEDFRNFTINSNGGIYANSSVYSKDMLQDICYGSSAELKAAGDIFPYHFEVYENGRIILSVGNDAYPVKRLRFSGHRLRGHFDVYNLVETNKDREILRVNGKFILHNIIKIPVNPQSLYSAISFHLYGTNCLASETKNSITDYIVKNWKKFGNICNESCSVSYKNSSEYLQKIYEQDSYGGYFELLAASKIFKYRFDVYDEGNLYLCFGDQNQPIKRLKLSGNFPREHFDVLVMSDQNRLTISPSPGRSESNVFQSLPPTPPSNLATVSEAPLKPKRGIKRRARFTDKTRKNQLKKAKIQKFVPDTTVVQKCIKHHTFNKLKAVRVQKLHRDDLRRYLHRIAVFRYSQNHPQVHREAVSRYSQNHPEIHRTAVSKYSQNHPDIHREAVSRYSQNHPEVNREAVSRYSQNNPEVNVQAAERYRNKHVNEKREADKVHVNRKRSLPWQNKKLLGLTYNPKVSYETDESLVIGSMSHKCKYCFALKWQSEYPSMCCNLGRVQLQPYGKLPEPLLSLLTDNHPEHQHFLERIRKYNSCFQMTSFGAGEICNKKAWLPTYKVCGQVYHMVGSLLPAQSQNIRYLQVYFVGEDQREINIRCSNCPNVKRGLVEVLQHMLHRVNPYIRELKTILDNVGPQPEQFNVVIHSERVPTDSHRGRFNAPTTNEVALVMVGQQFEKRDIVLHFKNRLLKQISEIHRSYDALQYPLMFCFGEDGYKIDLPLRNATSKQPLQGKSISAAMFYAYRIMIRENDFNRLSHFRALFSQFLVDMYAKIETERLNFLRHNQKQLRVEQYSNLKDALIANESNINEIGQRVVLPSTFTGGPRYLHERTQDAMTYVRYYGSPDLFITFTCNPQWHEISEALLPGQKWYDRHDIVARVFHLKVKMLMNVIDKGCLFGEIRCYIFTVEWQKRGLPHVHILVWLKTKILADQINNVISAEIPDIKVDSILHEIVKANMIHGPCGALNPKSVCMQKGQCTKRYPKILTTNTFVGNNGYPTYRRRSPADGGQVIKIKDYELNNGWVVPYNPVLSRMFNAHINVEYCCDIKAIKYILKYINKGTDQAAISLEFKKDEIKFFETGRYLSTNEAVWRIFGYHIHERFPTVQHLAVHLENGQRVYFNEDNISSKVDNPPNTTLLGFFELCKTDNFAKTLLYVEVPNFYRWTSNKFIRRKQGTRVSGWPGILKSHALGRLYTVHPNDTHCYHLRMLLHVVKGPTSFDELKTVDGVCHPTFQSACNALGLLDDGQHWVVALEEAQIYVTPYKMRELFTIMMVYCSLPDPLSLWEKFKYGLADDMIRHHQKEVDSISESIMEEILNQCLILIEDMSLRIGGKVLPNYGLPSTKRTVNNLRNREYLRETGYDTVALENFVVQHEILLTTDQSKIYNDILNSIDRNEGKIFFLDAPGGTGKTFLLNLLLSKIRSCHKIALATASSGIAATLLDGGKTAHSAFRLPLNLVRSETPNCRIEKQSDTAKVLRECFLIVWDECTMMHKQGFEALDRCLQDIRNCRQSMGGMTVLLAGDFRQTLPVIPRGNRADEVKACFKNSFLWPSVKKISLKENMRVKLRGDETAGQFADLLLTIGNGSYNNKGGVIEITENLGTIVKSIDELIEKVYPDIKNLNQKSVDWFCERAILCPKNDKVNEINFYLLKSFEGEEMEYKSVDSIIKESDSVHYPVEFLNSQNPAGIPAHKLNLKVGAPIMLLRNLNPPKLCNGTRLQVKALKKQIIEATILTGSAQGESVVIPRIPLEPSDFPVQFKRLQFPVKVCFAMTINKSQGQSLKIAGIDLREDCFSHGQFYVGCSRVSSPKNLILLAPEGKTMNVVYKEVL